MLANLTHINIIFILFSLPESWFERSRVFVRNTLYDNHPHVQSAFRNIIVFISTFIIFLSFIPHPAQSRSNSIVARSNEPGCFWYQAFENQEDYIINLYYTEDYGESSELIREYTSTIEYHLEQGILSAITLPDDRDGGRAFSYDGGYTFEAIADNAHMVFDWLPSTDSLIAVNSDGMYSRDTLVTWIRPEWIGIRDNRGNENLYHIGWSPSDFIILSRNRPSWNPDTVHTNFSTTYSDSFFLIGTTTELEYVSAYLYRGLSPGELYYVDVENDLLFASADTGFTWLEIGHLPLPPGFQYRSEIEPGWQSGELIWVCYQTDPHLPDETYIYRTTDFGRTWESMNGEVYNDVKTKFELPQSITINLWPNPANGFVTIQLPQLISGELAIYNILGNQILTRAIPEFSPNVSLSLTNFSSGTYFLVIEESTQKLFSKKLIIIK
ncbi:MAG: T9SS type A sorting domain-containing protein [Candidatus Electryonea clarkiae]|nr:T9SS type A sorting domain-containing protein [Candidatus Electryonea clarkiae]MDP8288349.1 T9SS type A sorting domain-containing protein [Candidatus Electryonea clarkiae]